MNFFDLKKFYSFFSHLSKRERLVFYITLGFISLTMLDRLIISPVISKTASLDKEIQQEQTQIKRDLHILAQKDRIIRQSKKYASYAVKELSSEEVITAALKEVGDLANGTSVYLIDIKPAGIEKVGVSHCTGMQPASFLKENLGSSRFFYNNAGTKIAFSNQKITVQSFEIYEI